jgi:hypothetical protein
MGNTLPRLSEEPIPCLCEHKAKKNRSGRAGALVRTLQTSLARLTNTSDLVAPYISGFLALKIVMTVLKPSAEFAGDSQHLALIGALVSDR